MKTGLIAICVFCGVIIATTFFYMGRSGIFSESKNVIELVRYSLKDNSSSSSLVLSHRTFKNGEYMLHMTGEDFVVLSRIGGIAFDCFGSCVCRDARRVVTLSKSLFFGVTATTAMMAVGISGRIFKAECARYFSYDCEEDFIDSMVDKCVDRDGDYMNTKLRTYYCIGNCVPNNKLKAAEQAIQARDIICENFVLEGFVNVVEENEEKKDYTRMAVLKFRQERLIGFCKDSSQFQYMYPNPSSGNKYRREVYLCVATLKGAYSNIRCKFQKEGRDSTVYPTERD